MSEKNDTESTQDVTMYRLVTPAPLPVSILLLSVAHLYAIFCTQPVALKLAPQFMLMMFKLFGIDSGHCDILCGVLAAIANEVRKRDLVIRSPKPDDVESRFPVQRCPMTNENQSLSILKSRSES